MTRDRFARYDQLDDLVRQSLDLVKSEFRQDWFERLLGGGSRN